MAIENGRPERLAAAEAAARSGEQPCGCGACEILRGEHDDDLTPWLRWCESDDCPSSVCNGPHIQHTCPNGDVVTQRYDDPMPCPFCGRR